MTKNWKKLKKFQNHKIEKKKHYWSQTSKKTHMINPIWIAKTQISKTRCSQGYNRHLTMWWWKPAITLLHHNHCFFFWGGGEFSHFLTPKTWFWHKQSILVKENWALTRQISKNNIFNLQDFNNGFQLPGKDSSIFLVLYLVCSQIWLNLLVNDCQFSCITKLKKRTLVLFTPFPLLIFVRSSWQLNTD
jgi:hypothetical protein